MGRYFETMQISYLSYTLNASMSLSCHNGSGVCFMVILYFHCAFLEITWNCTLWKNACLPICYAFNFLFMLISIMHGYLPYSIGYNLLLLLLNLLFKLTHTWRRTLRTPSSRPLSPLYIHDVFSTSKPSGTSKSFKHVKLWFL